VELLRKIRDRGARVLVATRRAWLAAAAVALLGVGSHAACEPVALALTALAQRLGAGWAIGFARGVTVLWELAADAVLVSAALRVHDDAPHASLFASLWSEARAVTPLATRLWRRALFAIRPFALACLALGGAVSIGRLLRGELYASLHPLSDGLAQIVSRSLAVLAPLLVLLVLLMPLVREALALAVARTDRSLRFRGRDYPLELIAAAPVLPLALLALVQAAAWVKLWR
jgi:hypothetical protein